MMFLNSKICWIFWFILSLPALAQQTAQIGNFNQLRTWVTKTTSAQLIERMREFIQHSRPARLVGTVGHKSAQEYLTKTLQQFSKTGQLQQVPFTLEKEQATSIFDRDFELKIKPYHAVGSAEYQKWDTHRMTMKSYINNHSYQRGMNLVWEKKGESDQTLVLVAHYDTIAFDKDSLKIKDNVPLPGADYNASGVVILIELIRMLDQIPLKNTIQVALLDCQGLGFLGAYAHAQSLIPRKDKIIGVINLEMLGHDSKFFDQEKKYFNMAVYHRSKARDPQQADLNLIKQWSSLVSKNFRQITFTPVGNDFDQSDHFRYWDIGIPSVTYSQNWESDFNHRGHQSPNDFVETINQKTYLSSFHYLAMSALSFGLDLHK